MNRKNPEHNIQVSELEMLFKQNAVISGECSGIWEWSYELVWSDDGKGLKSWGGVSSGVGADSGTGVNSATEVPALN